jgi:RNA polymerase sigma factor (sigma-70 family)
MPEISQKQFTTLLRLVREGDLDARERLFDLVAREEGLGGDLLRAARRILRPGDRARDYLESRDLIQTALRAGWIDAGAFQGATREEFLAWLRTILRRKLLKAVRRKLPLGALDTAKEVEGPSRDEEESPLSRLLRDELRSKVRKAIQELPDDQKAVVRLRLQGLDGPKIAAALGIEAAAARKRESRAAKRLREVLKEMGI